MGEFDQHEGEAQTIVNLAEAAMHMYRAAIDSLPFPEDKKFQKRAEIVLTGMRKLRAALTEAASHSRPTPTVMMALSDVRRRYDDLMERAADAPGSTLGQQLYNARIHAKLSAHEAANGFGLRRELPDELEEGAHAYRAGDTARRAADCRNSGGGGSRRGRLRTRVAAGRGARQRTTAGMKR